MTAWRAGLLWCLVWGVIVVPTAFAGSAVRLTADIAPRPLSEALDAFGRQTGLQLIYVSSVAETRQSKGAPAGLTAPDALVQLLDGTGLEFEFLNARTVRIFAEPTTVPTLTTSAAVPPRHSAPRGLALEEVVVSGARGQEPLSRVPIDMAVWTEKSMEASDIKGIAEIAALTPGVTFGISPILGDEYTDLVIRGVTSRHGVAVGIYVDDSPIPPNRAATYLTSIPLTFDLNRVEILRGPQTVLLGDHALSGAVRFIPNQPSLTTRTSLFRAEWGTTQYGSPSYEAGAAVGGPIVPDELGFRVSGWFREDGGYVDRVYPFDPNLVLDKDSNRHVSKVFRGALTFAPATGVQITPSLMYQSIYIHDIAAFNTMLSDPARGVFKDASLLQQPWEQHYYLASLKLTASLRSAELSAVASYFDQSGSWYSNATSQTPVDLTDASNWIIYELEQRAAFSELRLSSFDTDAALTWVTGVVTSWDHGRHPYEARDSGNDATVIDQNELAGFGQVALKVNTHFTANAGVRIGRWTYDAVTEYSNLRLDDSDTWVAPQFGLSWQADPRALFYLTVAKGYGSGGVAPQNPNADPPGFSPPAPYLPDTLWSYEIGSKHSLRDGKLRLETSFFHIDWNDGPMASASNEQGAIPGRAVSNGVGFIAEALLGDHVKVGLNLAYTDAHVTQTVATFVSRGDALPISPWNVTASFEGNFPLRAGAMLSVRVEDAFRSAPGLTYADNPANEGFYAPGRTDPSANVLNLHAAVIWSRFELAAFLNNALNSHPVLTGKSAAVTTLGAPMAVTLVPRTLSISGTWQF
jgi:outer membrane receptor protein involved in Fe transport